MIALLRYGLVLGMASLASCSLFGLTEEQQSKLEFFQENSARYYGAERFAQALDLANQGLEIAPDDYKLLATRAWCHLRQVEARPKLLAECDRQFEALYDMRDADDHDAPALMGRAETQKRIGVRHWERSRDLARAAKAEPDNAQKTIHEADSEGHSERARYHFEKAQIALEALIRNEMALRFANKQLMDIAVTQDDYESAVDFAHLCLKHSRDEQDVRLKQIRETPHVREEREARERYKELVDQELRIRDSLAEMHYKKANFAESLIELDAILDIDPTRSVDYYNRANTLLKLDRASAARLSFQKFLSSTKLPVDDRRVVRALEYTSTNRRASSADNTEVRRRAELTRDG